MQEMRAACVVLVMADIKYSNLIDVSFDWLCAG